MQLPHLTSICLGLDTPLDIGDSSTLLPLLEGPTRIEFLEDLILECTWGKIGKKLDIGDKVDEVSPVYLGDDGWEVPDFCGWSVEGIEQLRSAGEANGVRVSGNMLEAIEVKKAIAIELGNRLILLAYQTKSFLGYSYWMHRMSSFLVAAPRLFDLDFDNLDPEHLRLVKTELPEEDWYEFSLEQDTVNVESQAEEKEEGDSWWTSFMVSNV